MDNKEVEEKDNVTLSYTLSLFRLNIISRITEI